MIGAIIGDIAGSRFEFRNYRQKDFELFTPECSPTDDSIMTVALGKAILSCNGDYTNLSQKAIECMQEFGKRYPHCGFGGMFRQWIREENPQPNGSFGNGAAMRVSGAGFAARTLDEAKELSYKVTCVSHNHSEGIKGAEAVAVAIFLARQEKSKQEIRKYIEENYYKIDFTLDEIRPTYRFNETCQGTVPQAFEAFFEADSFEDTIRNAISIGGDSDTLAAIAGSIAEAYYGVPMYIRFQAEDILSCKELLPVFYWLDKFEEQYP